MATTDILAEMQDHNEEMVALRHRIHAQPELGFEETVTSELVAERLKSWGYQVHRGLGKTGVVGQLRVGSGTRSIGLRADMDALPILETTGLGYSSKIAGKMHACGHDGHTASLLAAARHLAATRRFSGTLNLIFQPAEEGLGGARVMMDDGLFERFPCDAVYAFHNMPRIPTGQFGFRAGPFMASSDTVTIVLNGRGGHGATPHLTTDPVVACASIVMALQTVVARNVDPQEMAVVTVGAMHAGQAPNVIPGTAELKLSVRAHRADIRDLLEARIKAIVTAQAESFGVSAEIDYNRRYPVLVNHERETEYARQVARDWLGDERIVADMPALTGSEDFAFMLEERPGCYFVIGNGDGAGGCMVHNPGYDFNDRILPLAAGYWVRLTEDYLQ
jgi:hippurate hydrolase